MLKCAMETISKPFYMVIEVKDFIHHTSKFQHIKCPYQFQAESSSYFMTRSSPLLVWSHLAEIVFSYVKKTQKIKIN